jgi:hypothetical protein
VLVHSHLCQPLLYAWGYTERSQDRGSSYQSVAVDHGLVPWLLTSNELARVQTYAPVRLPNDQRLVKHRDVSLRVNRCDHCCMNSTCCVELAA